MRRVDIVVPAFNEEACLEAFHAALAPVLDRLPYRFRVLFVDDGSRDGTREVCRALAARDPRVGWLSFSRNFGHQAALTAGLDASDADAVITMDADLQHPPSALPDFLAAWEGGAELVSGVRADTHRLGLLKRLSSRAFYRLLNTLSKVPVLADSPDFRLLDRRVVDAVRRLREQGRFLRGIYGWVGFRQASVAYSQADRTAGESKYGLFRMLAFALSALLSFSRTPLRFATWAGLVVSALAFIYGLYAIAQAVVFQVALPGWTSLAVLVSFLSGIQLLTLGVVGEYLGQVLDEVKARPLYLVADQHLPPLAPEHPDPGPESA
ncbi:MAG: glycosyltransferase family 2 protein [Deltaproteobacteria bacterium]|nr:glycosyltransferase family 2 protein [Deltaproteobacteria bacterium]MCB9785456.1 glycosyltransferase family 2 protein [Deltaproteobacteria bacterium]